MYFYVFLQPEMFEEAYSDGEEAVLNIAFILSGFLQNCFISVFEDDRWGQIVKEKINSWPATETRKRIKTLLTQFIKRKRFIYNIVPDYEDKILDLECVFAQATAIHLDLLLVSDTEFDRTKPERVEVSTRKKYQLTSFEPIRSDLAVHGRTCVLGEIDEIDFMHFHFAKALKTAVFIHICDRVCGTKSFTGNFRYTTKLLFQWLGNTLADPSKCNIVFHLGQPPGKGKDFILGEIASWKKGPLSKATIEINFYDDSLPDPTLPHQRFFLTDQIALDIDRGLDFIDGKTKKCRDTYINYQNPSEANKLLKSYASGLSSSHKI